MKHSQPLNLQSNAWAIVYSKKSFNDANTLLDMLYKASGAFGVQIGDPQWVECPDGDKEQDFIKPI